MKVDILWKTRDKEIGIPENTFFLEAKDLKDRIGEENEDILKKVILCRVTGRPFRITKQEFDFYQSTDIPVPDTHPNERYFSRLAMKPKRDLHVHNCVRCEKEVASVYTKEFGVYCEECYEKEMY